MLALLTWVFRSVCRVSRCQWVWWVQEVDEVCGLLPALASRFGALASGKLLVAWYRDLGLLMTMEFFADDGIRVAMMDGDGSIPMVFCG